MTSPDLSYITLKHDNMNNKRNEAGDPGEAYRNELKNEGSTFTDTNAESAARDEAKMQKAAAGITQKMDGGNPHADSDDSASDEEIRRETIEKK